MSTGHNKWNFCQWGEVKRLDRIVWSPGPALGCPGPMQWRILVSVVMWGFNGSRKRVCTVPVLWCASPWLMALVPELNLHGLGPRVSATDGDVLASGLWVGRVIARTKDPDPAPSLKALFNCTLMTVGWWYSAQELRQSMHVATTPGVVWLHV